MHVAIISVRSYADARVETDMQNHDTDYCSFREIKTVVVTWNAGASTPASLQYDDNDMGSFREMLHVESPPEILVFGFQELVDLDDKKLTASSSSILPGLYTTSDSTLNRKYFQREQEKGCVRTGTYESKIYSLARFSGKIH